MKLEDIKPKYIVLNQTYDDFAQDTEEINYEEEDYLSQVLDITSVLYTNSLETIWGLLGFTWDIYNDYGHFNNVSMEFSVIPRIPDAHRLKRFTRTLFANVIKRNIELLDSNFENIEEVNDISNCTNKEFIFHLKSVPENVKLNILNGAINEANTKTNAVTLYCKDNHIVNYKTIGNANDVGLGETNTNRFFVLNKDNKNKKHYFAVSDNNTNGAVKNVIYYDEDDVFDTKDYFDLTGEAKNNAIFILMAKSNQFILHPFRMIDDFTYYSPMRLMYPNIPFTYSYIKNVVNKLDNFINITIDFENTIDNAVIDISPNVSYKEINFINLDKIQKPIKYNYLCTNLKITRELNNLDWFKNECSFDELFKAVADGNLINNSFITHSLNLNDELSEEFDTVHINLQIINQEDFTKDINLHNQNISIDYLFSHDKYNIKTDTLFPFNFTNCENSIIYFENVRSAIVTYDDENGYTFDGIDASAITPKCVLNNTVACKTFIDNTTLGTNKIEILAKEENNTIIANKLYIKALKRNIRYYYELDNIPNYKAPIKLIINNDDHIVGVFYCYLFFYHTNNTLNSFYNSGDVLNLFNAINNAHGYINIAEIDNKNNHVFDEHDYILLGCAGTANISSISSAYKNVKLKYKGANCYIIPSDISVNLSLYVIFDVEHWDAIYNVSIEFVTVQTDIHIFVNAVLNVECSNKTLSFVHENYIQLSEEEKEKLINLGYTVVDKII